MFNKIKRRRTDILFSLKMRQKITYCEKCGNGGELQVSHYYGRRNESVRFEIDNVDIICFSCHRKFHESPEDYHQWKLRKLGISRFNSLDVQAHTYKKRDDKMDLLFIKSL